MVSLVEMPNLGVYMRKVREKCRNIGIGAKVCTIATFGRSHQAFLPACVFIKNYHVNLLII